MHGRPLSYAAGVVQDNGPPNDDASAVHHIRVLTPPPLHAGERIIRRVRREGSSVTYRARPDYRTRSFWDRSDATLPGVAGRRYVRRPKGVGILNKALSVGVAAVFDPPVSSSSSLTQAPKQQPYTHLSLLSINSPNTICYVCCLMVGS
jgi:hypothetical protein